MSMSWKIGYPGWRLAYQLGCPIIIKVDVFKDSEAGVYYATSEHIGLAVESESLDELIKEIHAALPVLWRSCCDLPKDAKADPKTDIRLHDDLVAA